MGKDRGKGVSGQRLGAVHLPQQVEGSEALGGGGQEVGLLQEHHQNRSNPKMVGLREVMVEGSGEALECITTRLLRHDAQQVGQLLPTQIHGEAGPSPTVTAAAALPPLLSFVPMVL